jgi:hypothetical protein
VGWDTPPYRGDGAKAAQAGCGPRRASLRPLNSRALPRRRLHTMTVNARSCQSPTDTNRRSKWQGPRSVLLFTKQINGPRLTGRRPKAGTSPRRLEGHRRGLGRNNRPPPAREGWGSLYLILI